MKSHYTITAIGLYHDPEAIGRLERLTDRLLSGKGCRSRHMGSTFYYIPQLEQAEVAIAMTRNKKEDPNRQDLEFDVVGPKDKIENGITYLRRVYPIITVRID
jgi:hypothetical protein